MFRVQCAFCFFLFLVAWLVIAPRCWSLSGHGDVSFNDVSWSNGIVMALSCYIICYINGIVMFVFVLSPDFCDFWGRALRRGATGNAVLVPRGRATGQWMGARWCQATPVIWCFKMFHAWTYCHPRFTWSIVSPEVCLCPQMALSAQQQHTSMLIMSVGICRTQATHTLQAWSSTSGAT